MIRAGLTKSPAPYGRSGCGFLKIQSGQRLSTGSVTSNMNGAEQLDPTTKYLRKQRALANAATSPEKMVVIEPELERRWTLPESDDDFYNAWNRFMMPSASDGSNNSVRLSMQLKHNPEMQKYLEENDVAGPVIGACAKLVVPGLCLSNHPTAPPSNDRMTCPMPGEGKLYPVINNVSGELRHFEHSSAFVEGDCVTSSPMGW